MSAFLFVKPRDPINPALGQCVEALLRIAWDAVGFRHDAPLSIFDVSCAACCTRGLAMCVIQPVGILLLSVKVNM